MDHPLVAAIAPLLDRIGASVVPVDERAADDIPLRWEGAVVAAVRLPEPGITDALDRLIAEVEKELGGRLADLPRTQKQRAVRLLDERGAFTLRRSAAAVAQALGVTRFTVYNYLNRADD